MMEKVGSKIAKHSIRLAVFVALAASSQPTFSKEKQVRYLTYKNCGSYTVDTVYLNYKSGNSTKQMKVGSTLPGYYKSFSQSNSGNAICVDLTDSRFDGIKEGDEVWLIFKIESGDKENCRMDNKRIKSSSQTLASEFASRGETRTNNRCKHRIDAKYPQTNMCQVTSTEAC